MGGGWLWALSEPDTVGVAATPKGANEPVKAMFGPLREKPEDFPKGANSVSGPAWSSSEKSADDNGDFGDAYEPTADRLFDVRPSVNGPYRERY